MKGKVLILEDEVELANLMAMYLDKDGFEVRMATSAEQALEVVENWSPGLITLDLNLPGMDGFEFLSHLRKNHTIPVLILSAREADEDIILGLGIGADEYVTKPVSPRVFVARVRAMLRFSREEKDRTIHKFGEFELDTRAFSLICGGEKVNLSAKEIEVLLFLVENSGQVFTSEEIFDQVWKQKYGDLGAVGVYIQRLRKKLGDNPESPTYLHTIRGKGYMFKNQQKPKPKEALP